MSNTFRRSSGITEVGAVGTRFEFKCYDSGISTSSRISPTGS